MDKVTLNNTIKAYEAQIAKNEKDAKKHPAIAPAILDNNIALKVRLNELKRVKK